MTHIDGRTKRRQIALDERMRTTAGATPIISASSAACCISLAHELSLKPRLALEPAI